MKKTTILIAILISIVQLQSFAQGAWNIKYLPLSSVDSTIIGKEIRLDFRKNAADTADIKSLVDIRKLLSTKDSVTLEIGKDSIRFVETWKIYPDHGVVSEQILQGIGKDTWIKEFYIKTISRKFFTLEAVIYTGRSQEKRQVWIPKAQVKGVLIAMNK